MAEVDIEVKRRMGEADIATVSDLVAAAAAADDHRPLGEHKWLDLVQGGRRGTVGLVAWERGHGHAVGYAQLSRGRSSWAIDLVVHPHHRSEPQEVSSRLLAAALAEVAAGGGGHVHLWIPKPSPADDAVALDNGLSRGRELLQLRRSLPLPGTRQPLRLRPFRPGKDEQRWLEVNNRAFAWHPEQGGWDMETILSREAEDWFDPSGFLLWEQDGELAGFCWTKVHTDLEPHLGEIYVVAVDPAWQGQGAGRRLVEAGLDHLAQAGLRQAMLYVDATNLAARRLYEDLGFALDHIDRAYVGDVRPGPGVA